MKLSERASELQTLNSRVDTRVVTNVDDGMDKHTDGKPDPYIHTMPEGSGTKLTITLVVFK